MTQPTPPQQPSQAQTDASLAIAAAAVLATAITVPIAVTALAGLFTAHKIHQAALRAALSVVMGHPPDRAGFHGPATAQAARLNLIRRAQFLVNSSRRFNEVLARIAAGAADPRELLDLMERERRYYGQHLEAGWNRMNAAAQADSAALDYGALLGWYTVHDARTSPECRAADKHNFRVDAMPSIGFPGGVHTHCRCMPGPPFPGASVLGPATVMGRGKRPVSVHRPQHQPAFAGKRR